MGTSIRAVVGRRVRAPAISLQSEAEELSILYRVPVVRQYVSILSCQIYTHLTSQMNSFFNEPDKKSVITREPEKKACPLKVYAEDEKSGVWPECTGELCGWDMQPFSGPPIGIPRRYAPRDKKIEASGYFCSLSCALAKIVYEENNDYEMRKRLVAMARDYYDADEIFCAPPREYLSKLYAETKDMKEATRRFREAACETKITQNPVRQFIRVTHAYDEERRDEKKAEQHKQRLRQMKRKAVSISHTPFGRVQQRKLVASIRKKRKTVGAIDMVMKLSE
jgi:hypothetical protein